MTLATRSGDTVYITTILEQYFHLCMSTHTGLYERSCGEVIQVYNVCVVLDQYFHYVQMAGVPVVLVLVGVTFFVL